MDAKKMPFKMKLTRIFPKDNYISSAGKTPLILGDQYPSIEHHSMRSWNRLINNIDKTDLKVSLLQGLIDTLTTKKTLRTNLNNKKQYSLNQIQIT